MSRRLDGLTIHAPAARIPSRSSDSQALDEQVNASRSTRSGCASCGLCPRKVEKSFEVDSLVPIGSTVEVVPMMPNMTASVSPLESTVDAHGVGTGSSSCRARLIPGITRAAAGYSSWTCDSPRAFQVCRLRSPVVEQAFGPKS